MLALVQASSDLVSVLRWAMPPTETMFLAHAWGREFWLPVLLCDWQITMSLMNRMSSISVEMLVYCVVCVEPHELL